MIILSTSNGREFCIQIYGDQQQELELSFDIFIQNMYTYLYLSDYNSFVPLFDVCFY